MDLARGGWGLIAAGLAAASVQGGSIVYVDDGAAAGGDGSSWQGAHRFLQDALAGLAGGGRPAEIRVAGGVYHPDRTAGAPGGSGDRAASFVQANGVTIMGGWAGHGAPDPNARNASLYPTVLSGDLAGDDQPGFGNIAENSFHVVVADGVDPTAILDGITIRGGNADGPGDAESGGGIFARNAAPTISNCRLEGNWALEYGGAMHLDAASPQVSDTVFAGSGAGEHGGAVYATTESEPVFAGCTFRGGAAIEGGLIYADGGRLTIRASTLSEGIAGSGGAVYLEGGALSMVECALTDNLATKGDYGTYGGAIYSHGDLTLEDVTFTGNVADDGGCAVYAGSGSAVISGCVFTGNGGGPQGSRGGAIYTSTDIALSDCSFTSNTAGAFGGAVYVASGIAQISGSSFFDNEAQIGGVVRQADFSELTMQGCTFSENRATNGTGGAYQGTNYLGSLAIVDCSFEGNTASQHGGAISVSVRAPITVAHSAFIGNSAAYFGGACEIRQGSWGAPITISDCSFRANAANVGGALYSLEALPVIRSSRIIGNTATAWGGAMYNGFSNTVYEGTLIHGNTAALRGGALNNFRSDVVLSNCTVTHNIAGDDGGGIYNQTECFPEIENAIVWGNADGGPADFSAQVNDAGGSTTALAYSCVQGWHPGLGGEGNIASAPLLADPDGADGVPGSEDDDLSLLAGSPAIDAGRNGAVPESILVDLAGSPRFADDPASGDTGCGAPGVVDMGAYEFQGVPLEPLTGDIDGNHALGVNDLLALLGSWGPCGDACCLADLDGSGLVGLDDLLILLEDWE